jgi:DNA-binding Xre family transcriptional regulator
MEDYEISLRQFQRIESGATTNITLSNLFRIARALQISLSDLLDV